MFFVPQMTVATDERVIIKSLSLQTDLIPHTPLTWISKVELSNSLFNAMGVT